MSQYPVGTVVAYGATVTTYPPPTGWLLCDGSAVVRATYSLLFDAIGITNGQGDGQTTFNLPDHRGMFLRGVDDGVGRDRYAAQRHAPAVGGALGDTVGSVEGSHTALPSQAPFTADPGGKHTHGAYDLPVNASYYKLAGSHYGQWNGGQVETTSAGAHSHTVTGGDSESRPVNVSVNYLIYAATTDTGATP